MQRSESDFDVVTGPSLPSPTPRPAPKPGLPQQPQR
jgi:hypothetical protein